MYKKGLVSILIPCYNVERCIQPLMESILKQTYKKYEIIAVNDASTDESEKVLLAYKKRFEEEKVPFIYIAKKVNEGAAGAINDGLKYVNGEYLIWPDADDYLTKDSIKMRVDLLNANEECGICCGQMVRIEKNTNQVIEQMNVTNREIIDNYFEEIVFKKTFSTAAQGGNMIRMRQFDKCVNNRSIFVTRFGQNYQMILPMAYYNKCIVAHEDVYIYISAPEGNYRSNISSYEQNRNRDKLQEECLKAVVNTLDLQQDEKEIMNRIIEITCCLVKLMTIARHKKFCEKKKYAFELANKVITLSGMESVLKEKKLWVWGAGYYGKMWGELFENAGFVVNGYIESNQNICDGKTVIYKENIESKLQNDFIFVSMQKYYYEVTKILEQKGYTRKDYLYMPEMLSDWKME